MHIQAIKLKCFRNFEELNIEFSEGLNVLYGDNAQGKTSILEAMFICSSGRSHKTTKDSEIIRNVNNSYYVRVSIIKKDTSPIVEVYYEEKLKKRISINEIPIKKLGTLMGNLIAVMFSPEDLQVIKEGPSLRRRFIDIAISQIKPSYFYNLQQYNKILSERNALLRQQSINPDELAVWDSQLVSVGNVIMDIRRDFSDKLSDLVEIRHRALSDGKEKLNIKYRPSVEGDFSQNLKRVLLAEKIK